MFSAGYVVVAVLAAFAGLGFWRGWLREVFTLGGMVVAWLIMVALGGVLVDMVNHAALIASFTVRGGFDAVDANTILRQLRAAPLVEPYRPDLFLGIFFALAVVGVIVAAMRYAPAPSTRSAQALGALVGAANGYFISYVLFKYVAPSAQLSVSFSMSAASLATTMGQYLGTLLVVGVLAAIGLALLTNGGLSRRPHAKR